MSMLPRFAKLEAKLNDPLWRLTSGELYKIAPADGSGIRPFIPSPVQLEVIHELLDPSVDELVVTKSRRPGISTLLGIWLSDKGTFGGGLKFSLIDQNAQDAAYKLDNIVGVALDNLPAFVLKRITWLKRNDSHYSWAFGNRKPSHFYAGKSARGGSNDVVWVSEWGVIQYEDPKRSRRIRSGALPSARHGRKIIETTWAGGKAGDLWEIIGHSLEGRADDWKVLFFPWWRDARNVHESAVIDDVARLYFEKIDSRLKHEGVNLTEQQMRWWAQEKRTLGIFMARENPTFIDEMWTSPVPGAIYAEAIDRARGEGRVGKLPVDPTSLVHVVMDLGAPRQTVVWYFQIVGAYVRMIDMDMPNDETLFQRVARMKAKGYPWGSIYFPHDGRKQGYNGHTLADEFLSHWKGSEVRRWDEVSFAQNNFRFIPRCDKGWTGINKVLEIFPVLEFRTPACEDALGKLAMYRMQEVGSGAIAHKEPVHDEASHFADPLRYLGEAMIRGMIAFKHGNQAEPLGKPKGMRRGMKEMRVG